MLKRNARVSGCWVKKVRCPPPGLISKTSCERCPLGVAFQNPCCHIRCLFCSMSSEELKENQGAVRMNSTSEADWDIFALEQLTGRPSILRQSQADNISRTAHRGAKVGFLEVSMQFVCACILFCVINRFSCCKLLFFSFIFIFIPLMAKMKFRLSLQSYVSLDPYLLLNNHLSILIIIVLIILVEAVILNFL